MTDTYLSVREVARRLGISPNTVYRRIADGKLDAIDIGDSGIQRLRVPETALRAFIDRSAISHP